MRYIDWTGRIAWVNTPTNDHRWIEGIVTMRHRASVVYRRPEESHVAPSVIGVVLKVFTPEDPWRADEAPHPVYGVLRLDIGELAQLKGFLYPEPGFDTSPVSVNPDNHRVVLRCPVLHGVFLGENPLWTGIDPVIQDSESRFGV